MPKATAHHSSDRKLRTLARLVAAASVALFTISNAAAQQSDDRLQDRYKLCLEKAEARVSPRRYPASPKQGQYLAFIHAYTLVLGRPPAHADLLRHFRVTPPSVNQMLMTLECQGAEPPGPLRTRTASHSAGCQIDNGKPERK